MTDATPSVVSLPLDDHQALDRFIVHTSPDWLKTASYDEVEGLRSSLLHHHQLQVQVSTLLAQLQPVEAFAVSRLAEALRELCGCDPQVRRAVWRDVRLQVEYPVFRITDIDLPVFRHYPRDSDLLQRLLQNFGADQASAGYYYPGAGIVDQGRLLKIGPERVAARCRELDVGGQYQAHLDEVLTPADPAARRQVLQLLGDDKRATLAAHAWCSRLKGQIEAAALPLLLELANAGPAAASARGLQLLGCKVPDALLLEVPVADQSGLARQLLLYLPNDSLRPLRQYGSWNELNDGLVADLRDERYVVALALRLKRDERLGFLGKLRASLAQASPQLQAKALVIASDPFAALAEEQIERIKGEAAALVVPTAAVDQQAHRRWVQALESAGLSVAGVLASFIPGVGELMLAGLVKDLLSEVYEGVVDWSHGQREEALEHLLGVVSNLAATALVAAGSVVAIHALRRSGFVDRLVPVLRGDGSRRLWSAQLEGYQSTVSLRGQADADGLTREQGRHWWRSAGQLFEVRQDPHSQRWRLVDPLHGQAWSPELVGNGDGAWWTVGEHPLQWQGVATLLRRLGPRSANLTDAACEQAALICGYDEARLRALLVEQRAMPVALRQVLADFDLETRIQGFFRQLDEGVALDRLDDELCRSCRELVPGNPTDADEAAAWRADAPSLRVQLFEQVAGRSRPTLGVPGQALQRVFPGLPGPFIEALLADVAAPQLARMESGGRIPLAVQEQARDTLREVRVMQALEGLYLDPVCGSDSVRLVFALFRRLPRWPRGLSFELREAHFAGPLLERLLPAFEARETCVLVGDRGRFEVFDERGVPLAGTTGRPLGLYQAILEGLGPQRSEQLGYGGQGGKEVLRNLLCTQATGDRQQLPGLLGMSPRPSFFRTPQRLVDGRLGYPLSGRGTPGRVTLTGMVRTLYPSFDDLQASIWLDELQQRNLEPMSELLRGLEHLRLLDDSLAGWLRESPVFRRSARRRVADEIRRSWCRQSPAVRTVEGRVIGYRLRLEYSNGGDLPELPADVDFSHVLDLGLAGAGQAGRVDAFLRSFTRLRWLDLGHNGCRDIPPALSNMTDLRELHLGDNSIQLSDAGQATLSTLTRLEVLDLDRNPLERTLDVSQLPRLRRLSLRGTGISSLPRGLLRRPFLELADLRGNQLRSLPEDYFTAPVRLRVATILFGNPLPAAVRERLWTLEHGVQLQETSPDAVREQWLEGLGDILLQQRSEQWQSLRDESGSQAFFDLLARLLDTSEFRLVPSHLRERVWQMIAAAVEDSELRESLFQVANAPTTCVDSVTSSFSQLEVRLLVSLARGRALSGDQGTALLALARRLFRLDRLEQHAREVIAQRRLLGDTVDEVEMSLAFRVRLAQDLDLPGQPRTMQFGYLSGVSPMDLTEARRTVDSAEAGPQLATFIARCDFWIDYLREQHGRDFRKVEGDFWARLESLSEQHEQLPEGDYLQRMNQLGSDRETALDALALSLTERALEDAGKP